jgi:heme exporter protein D
MGGFLSMGGYGAYIWPAYAIALVALGGLLLWSLRARLKVRRELEARGLDRRARERTP